MRFGIVSLGCPKNLVDSEILVGRLLKAGWEFTDVDLADVVVVNTCAFLESAVEEAIDTILEYVETGKKVYVAGCLVERYRERLVKELPEVAGWIGTGGIDDPLEVMEGDKAFSLPPAGVVDYAPPPMLLTLPHLAYVKIAEGCSHTCTFCIIPRLRGHFRSREKASILREVREYVERGVREFILVAQDTTAYGRDIGEDLPGLLKDIARIVEDGWVRIMYGHPLGITDELLLVLRDFPQICRYLDIPFQHVSGRILRLMGRGNTDVRRVVEKVRDFLPDVIIRTSFIVGFPGERGEDFSELVSFVGEGWIDRLGVFVFSPEEGSPAFNLPDRVPLKVADERAQILLSVQRAVSLRKNRRILGSTVEVIVDKPGIGRTQGDAPEIDNVVYIEGSVQPGDFACVEVRKVGPYHLKGRVVNT